MFRERLVGVEVRRIDTEPCSERFDAGVACRELVERVEAGKGFGFRAAYHQRQTRQNGEMPRIADTVAAELIAFPLIDGKFSDFDQGRRRIWLEPAPAQAGVVRLGIAASK